MRPAHPPCRFDPPPSHAHARLPPQGHESDLLDQLTGGRVVPTAVGEEAGGGSAAPADASSSADTGSSEAFRPSTFSFLRSVTLQREEKEERGPSEGAESLDPAAAEATRRAFETAVLAQWQRLRAHRAS